MKEEEKKKQKWSIKMDPRECPEKWMQSFVWFACLLAVLELMMAVVSVVPGAISTQNPHSLTHWLTICIQLSTKANNGLSVYTINVNREGILSQNNNKNNESLDFFSVCSILWKRLLPHGNIEPWPNSSRRYCSLPRVVRIWAMVVVAEKTKRKQNDN